MAVSTLCTIGTIVSSATSSQLALAWSARPAVPPRRATEWNALSDLLVNGLDGYEEDHGRRLSLSEELEQLRATDAIGRVDVPDTVGDNYLEDTLCINHCNRRTFHLGPRPCDVAFD